MVAAAAVGLVEGRITAGEERTVGLAIDAVSGIAGGAAASELGAVTVS